MIILFGAAIFISAVLLFLVQPIAAKLVLPILGGTPNVWNTAMVFFQTMLLLGYFYSHLVSRRLRLPMQFVVHACVMGSVLLALPIGLPSAAWAVGSGFSPPAWLLMTLLLIAGLPYFAVATTGPLLQSWFGATDDPRAKDPYFLYAASNAGSLVGLLCFPFLVEPNFILSGQSEVWTVGFAILGALVLCSGLMALRNRTEHHETVSDVVREPIRWRRRSLWIALAAAPSSLSLGTTTTITMDVAAVPLMWIMPLSVYLLSYILAFSSWFRVGAVAAGRVAIVSVIAVLVIHAYGTKYPLTFVIGTHLAALGACAYACHRRLYELRPSTSRLTEFYLLAAIGGALGGAFTALVAPRYFTFLIEYPIAMGACILLVAPAAMHGRHWWQKQLAYAIGAVAIVVTLDALLPRFFGTESLPGARAAMIAVVCAIAAIVLPGANYRIGLIVPAVFIFSIVQQHLTGTIAYSGRSFFGTYTVRSGRDTIGLRHGTTLHGMQFRDPAKRRVASSYYHQKGPLGDIFAELRSRGQPLRVAAVGLGAGTVAAYAEKGDTFTFIEIDPLVNSIAQSDAFTYIKDARERGATIKSIIADGRLAIEASSDSYDLIILDAFSSDSVPVHLLTLEAVAIYKSHLRPGGIVAFHTSNRYFDLAVMCAQVALKNEMTFAIRFDLMKDENAEAERSSSDWIAIASDAKTLRPLLERPEWFQLRIDPHGRVWTDSYSSLFDVHWK